MTERQTPILATTQLNHVTPIVRVTSLAQGMTFFLDVLGFEQDWLYDTIGCVRRGTVVIFVAEKQGALGTCLWFHVQNVDAFRDEIVSRGAKIVEGPADMEHGMREMRVEDPDGNSYRFASDIVSKMKIKRANLDVRVEERLALVLKDLATSTGRTVGEVLEETVLHTFEPRPGGMVPSPHSEPTFELIKQLKARHSLDYGTHDSYRFEE
jgi:catechol 2,3-dioxygenase-like lactoylglutathione lyase family enzyme